MIYAYYPLFLDGFNLIKIYETIFKSYKIDSEKAIFYFFEFIF